MLLSVKKWGIILFLAVLPVLAFAANDTTQEKVTLNTREYENYRRFIIEIPDQATNETNTFVRPQIFTTPDSGIFSIIIKSENVQKFEGERLRKSEGDIPVRFVISYPDSNTIQIEGKSIQFDKITSFYLVDDNKYIFDLYKFANDDYFYSNSVKLLTPMKPEEKSQDTVQKSILARTKENTKKVTQSSPEITSILTQSIKTASVILSGLIFLIMATYFILKIYTGKNLFQDIKQFSHSSSKKSKPKKSKPEKVAQKVKVEEENKKETQEEEEYIVPSRPIVNHPIVDESAINSMLFDKKEREVRRIMHQKNLNYNEAEMVFNLTHGQF